MNIDEFLEKYPSNFGKAVTMPDGTIEIPCLMCDFPMLVGKGDDIDLVIGKDGGAHGVICAGCALKVPSE